MLLRIGGGVKERPILFNGPMVRAILSGAKTQTRRVMKPQPISFASPAWLNEKGLSGERWYAYEEEYASEGSVLYRCPYGQPGDRLIVASEIPGIPDAYCAGTNGVIYSRARDRSIWKPLKPWRQKKSYQTVTIMDGTRKRSLTVHLLVCSAFYGPAPSKAHQVRHLDGNPENGKPENLAWGTQEENWRDRRAHGNGCEGEKHHAAKFNDTEREHIRWAIQRGLTSQRSASRALGVSQATVSQMLKANELIGVEQELPSDRVPELTLEVTNVRVERLQDISQEDALAEGVEAHMDEINQGPFFNPNGYLRAYPTTAFSRLWESINGDGSWDANPWVWVIEFKRCI